MKKYFYYVTDKETKESVFVTLNMFLAMFGEVPETTGENLENDFVIGTMFNCFID